MSDCDLLPLVTERHLDLLDAPAREALERHLPGCAACQALERRVAAALPAPTAEAPPAPEGWRALRERIEADRARPGPRITLSCAYCHDALARGTAVHCASCLAAHHAECFRAHGTCSVPGCGETRVVLAQPLPGAPGRRPPGVLVGLGAGLLAGTLAAWALAPAMVRVAREPEGAPRPTAPPRTAPKPVSRPEAGLPPRAPRPPRPAAAPVAPATDDAALLAALRGLLAKPLQPDWDAIAGKCRQALAQPLSAELQAGFRELLAACELNLASEASYTAAVDIVSARDVESYPRAVRLLQAVDSRARIHPDARAYLEWIDADLAVRQAEQAWDLGEEQRAFELLRRSLACEALGPEARFSVQARQELWQRVANGFKLGLRCDQEGRSAEARVELERVLQLEPDRENWFHEQARSRLRRIADRSLQPESPAQPEQPRRVGG